MKLDTEEAHTDTCTHIPPTPAHTHTQTIIQHQKWHTLTFQQQGTLLENSKKCEILLHAWNGEKAAASG